MATPRQEAVRRAIREGACQLIQALDIANVGLPDPVGASNGLRRGAAFLLGCDQLNPPVPLAPSLTGGQCPVEYLITVSGTGSSARFGTEPFTNQSTGFGPFSGITEFEDRGTTTGTLFVKVTQGNGTPINLTVASFTTEPEIDVSAYSRDSISYSISFTRLDGNADNCGDTVAPRPTAPNRTEINTTIEYTNEDGTDINIPVLLVYGRAEFTANGTLSVPVRVQLDVPIDAVLRIGPETINVDFPVNGPVNTPENDDGDDPLPLPSPDKCDPPKPEDFQPRDPISQPPTGGEPPELEPEEEEPKRVIRAVVVSVSSAQNNRSSVIFQNSNPNIYAPALGYINFLYKVGNSSAWSEDIPVKNVRQLIPCPWVGGAIAVRGTPFVGVTWRLEPLYL